MTQSFGGIHSSVYNFPAAGMSCSSMSGGISPMFTMQWLSGTQIRMCYGCASPIRTDTSTVPPPPHDLIIRYKILQRSYHKNLEAHSKGREYILSFDEKVYPQ